MIIREAKKQKLSATEEFIIVSVTLSASKGGVLFEVYPLLNAVKHRKQI